MAEELAFDFGPEFEREQELTPEELIKKQAFNIFTGMKNRYQLTDMGQFAVHVNQYLREKGWDSHPQIDRLKHEISMLAVEEFTEPPSESEQRLRYMDMEDRERTEYYEQKNRQRKKEEETEATERLVAAITEEVSELYRLQPHKDMTEIMKSVVDKYVAEPGKRRDILKTVASRMGERGASKKKKTQ